MSTPSETPPPLPTPDASLVPETVRLEAQARVAGALGMAALSLVILGPCTCGTSVFIGGILGLGAAFSGMRARADEPSPAGRAWAQTAVTTGAIAAGFSLLTGLVFSGLLISQVIGTISAVEAIRSMIP